MKQLIINIALGLLTVMSLLGYISQCSQKKSAQRETISAVIDKQNAERDYLALVKAKTRIDTLYKDGKTIIKHHTDFKTITDTLYVEYGKVYGVFKDSIVSPELSLQATITASDLRAIDYTYSVREKIIREQSILTEHDTLIQVISKGQLIGLADIGLHSYSAGLQYQSRKRIGFTARYNWYQSDRFVSIGVAYRIY